MQCNSIINGTSCLDNIYAHNRSPAESNLLKTKIDLGYPQEECHSGQSIQILCTQPNSDSDTF